MPELLTLALPLIVGSLTFIAVQLVKHASTFVDEQPAAVKRLLALAIAFSVTWLAELAGASSPCTVAAAEGCLQSLTPTAVQGVIAALVAMAVHSLRKPAVA